MAKESEHRSSSLEEEASMTRSPLKEAGLGCGVLVPWELKDRTEHLPFAAQGFRQPGGPAMLTGCLAPPPGGSAPSILSARAMLFHQPHASRHGVQPSSSMGWLTRHRAPSHSMLRLCIGRSPTSPRMQLFSSVTMSDSPVRHLCTVPERPQGEQIPAFPLPGTMP